MTPSSPSSPVIVVGAGIAGLVCALELHLAGRPVVVLEAEPDVGGRVRSSLVDGFVLDHGFQVLFTAYPTLASYLDFDALALRRFQPAARIVRDGRVSRIGDALRDPSLLLETVFARAVSLGDKLRLLALRRFAQQLSVDECFAPRFADISTRAFLTARGFNATVIDGFFAPFYGGILLDRSLATSASIMLFTFKMLAMGDSAVPARGMGAITAQLAAHLPLGAVRVGVAVRNLEVADGRVVGVTLADGSRCDAADTVLATDAPAAAVLARTANVTVATTAALGCTTLYYTADRSPLPGRALWLNAAPDAAISHAITMTNVAPEYSTGQPLIAATAVGASAAWSDDALDRAARHEIATMAAAHGDTRPFAMTRLAIWRVPYAQFAQPPGSYAHRTATTYGVPGLWRASETLYSSSLDGAARGGHAAAQALLQSH